MLVVPNNPPVTQHKGLSIWPAFSILTDTEGPNDTAFGVGQ